VMAIAVRTFVLGNRGRHAAEGFDVCDLTHCQVLARATPKTDTAALATSGQLLVDHGQLAPVFYSSWCGGHTETPSHTWRGAGDPSYLPARPDPACADEPPWTTDIAEPQLRRALEAAGLKGSERRSASGSGRVAELRAAGMTPDHLDANAFRAAAGRLLGWQTVKSTLFDVRRTASGYTLTGRGSGHGVGLCVRGAMKRASGGASRDEILAAYFPGLTVTPRGASAGGAAASRVASSAAGLVPARAGSGEAAPKAVSSLMRVYLPEADRRSLPEVRDLATGLVAAVALRLGVPAPAEVRLRFHATVEAYTRSTGQPWWTAARSVGSRIDLLPLAVLKQRGILASTLRHEFVHVLAEPSLSGRPLWVSEGLAVFLAGESADETEGQRANTGLTGPHCPSDVALRSTASADARRRAYRDAGLCVERALTSGRRWQDLR
jgi:SpoIID/LytB domain protein